MSKIIKLTTFNDLGDCDRQDVNDLKEPDNYRAYVNNEECNYKAVCFRNNYSAY